MNQHNFKHKTLPSGCVVDMDTMTVLGFFGPQPETFVITEWIDNGDNSIYKTNHEIAEALIKKSAKAIDQAKAFKRYESLIKATNTESVSRQISGYTGE